MALGEALELAGRSERDRAVREYVRTWFLRAKGVHPELPTLLLLGPRGSGKTTLLQHLRTWAAAGPVAHLDLAELGRRGAKPIDLLARIVFDLNARKPRVPQLAFPTYGVLAIALSTRVDLDSRTTAVQQMRAALNSRSGRGGDQVRGVLEALFDTAASLVGSPAAIGPALRLLPGWDSDWASLRTRRRLARLRRRHGGGTNEDVVVSLNRLYNEHERAERERAEAALFDAFLADLCHAYRTRHGNHHRTSHCLLLLDNADSPQGNAFLESLLRARDRAGHGDPLLVVATAAGRPEALVRRERGATSGSRDYQGAWDEPRRFRPVPVDDVLHVGRLRDLHAREVDMVVETAVRSHLSQADLPEVDDVVQWLGWLVHQLTRGQPSGTATVVETLCVDDAGEPWDARLRKLFTPDLVARLLDRLLPLGITPELRAVLARAAAAVNLGDAGAARALWEDAGEATGGEFAQFSGDPLRTMRVTTGDDGVDGTHETLHPLLRFLLLRELATADPHAAGSTEAWDEAHEALSRRVGSRIEEGHAGERWAFAYHDLAAGRLEEAARYLDERFDEITAAAWCTELCRLRRAPIRTPGGAPGPPRLAFRDLVAFLAADGRPRSARTKAVTRLLAATWIAPEPSDDPGTDRVGDPYRNPLGDPFAELYADIREEFLILRGMVDDGADRHVFLQKSEQYRRLPWW
jgi:hypothetical protein